MELVKELQLEKDFAKNIMVHRVTPQFEGEFGDIPSSLHCKVKELLTHKKMEQLYSHQSKAIEGILAGRNVVISTGVASGKSLCYQLPLLHTCQLRKTARALCLFPTKALTQDQKMKLDEFTSHNEFKGFRPTSGIYDGDTLAGHKKQIREKANFIFTNPDMLHMGILPHHTAWADFFRNLKYVVVDEVHIYRGIFGSNVANVLRRLQRIAKFYKTSFQYILTSATLANTETFIKKLIETDFEIIAEDGSPQGEKHFMIYNPPIIDANLGIRRSAMSETIRLAHFIHPDKQMLIFAHSRMMVELILNYMQRATGDEFGIFGYRSGYLPKQRREIERMIREQEITTAIATNALELGIDIGGLEVVLINGYPGSISSTRQQAGRAGRSQQPSLAILIATSNLIDQYLVKYPEFVTAGNPEEALIDPDNAFVVMHHLKCAIFEKPFSSKEGFGDLRPDEVNQYLQLLKKYELLSESNEKFYWKSDSYPASGVSLRTSGASDFALSVNGNIIGTIDENSAYWLTHPQAVYLHGGEVFLVQNLDLENSIVELEKRKLEFYTKATTESEFELIELKKAEDFSYGKKSFGQVKVTERVTGYKRMKWQSNEFLGYGQVELPPTEMITSSYWISFKDEFVANLEEKKIWNNKANYYGSNWKEITAKIRTRDLNKCKHCGRAEESEVFHVHHLTPFKMFSSIKEANREENLITLCPTCHQLAEKSLRVQSTLAGLTYLMQNIAPFYLMCDSKDIRATFEEKSPLAENQPAIIIYDAIPGGIGLSEKLFFLHNKLLKEAWGIVTRCDCKEGCPSCVGPVAENGEGGRERVKELLKEIINEK